MVATDPIGFELVPSLPHTPEGRRRTERFQWRVRHQARAASQM